MQLLYSQQSYKHQHYFSFPTSLILYIVIKYDFKTHPVHNHFFCPQLNVFKYFYPTRMFLFTINHFLNAVNWYQVLLYI